MKLFLVNTENVYYMEEEWTYSFPVIVNGVITKNSSNKTDKYGKGKHNLCFTT